MKTDIDIAHDRFSWKRVYYFGKLYRWSLKRQLIVYGILSIVAAISILMPFNAVTQVSLFSMFGSALALVYYLAPLVLSKTGDTRMIMYMTPALPIEKWVFFMLYFLVLLPIVIFLPTTLCQLLYMRLPAVQTEPMMEIFHLAFDYDYNVWAKFIQCIALLLSCFYVILTAQGNRTLKGILIVIGIMIGLGIFGAICGFTMAMFDNYMIVGQSSLNSDMLYWTRIMTELKYPMLGLNIVATIYSLVLMWLSYKRLSHPKS